MGATRSNAWRRELKSWEVVDRIHHLGHKGRGTKDNTITRRARRRAKRELQKEIEAWDITANM